MSASVTWLEQWNQDSTLPSVPQIGAEVMSACKRLRACQGYSKRAITDYADAERSYRLEKAKQIIKAGPALIAEGIEKPSVAEKSAYVDLRVMDLKHAQIIADGMRIATAQSIKSAQAELSALQSLLAAYKSELQFARSGGGYES